MSRYRRYKLASVLMLAWLCTASALWAQTPSVDSGAAPALELNTGQKQAIYQSVSATQKNSPAPVGFRAAVGARVPDAIELQAISETLAGIVPAAKNLQWAVVERQVILVEPKSKTVVAVITHDQ
jgi:hypothetical protein